MANTAWSQLAAVAATVLLTWGTARAQQVTTVVGKVRSLTVIPLPGPLGALVGDEPVELSVTIDPTVPASTLSSNLAIHDDAVTAAQINIGSFTGSLDDAGSSRIEIRDDSPADRDSVRVQLQVVIDGYAYEVVFNLQDATLTALDGLSLTSIPGSEFRQFGHLRQITIETPAPGPGPIAHAVLFPTAVPCDHDRDGSVDTSDLLAFLADWFIDDPNANINGSAFVEVGDLLDFLNCWFTDLT